MVFFAAPIEDEVDDESDLDHQKHPDEFDVENYKGLEICTMNPCTYSRVPNKRGAWKNIKNN